MESNRKEKEGSGVVYGMWGENVPIFLDALFPRVLTPDLRNGY